MVTLIFIQQAFLHTHQGFLNDGLTDHGCIPVTEVKETAVVIRVLILKAEIRPAAQTVVSNTQLRDRRLCGFPT